MPARETRTERLAYRWCFVAILVAAVLLILEVWRTGGQDGLIDLAKVSGVSLVAVGKFVIFWPLGDSSTSFSPWALALLVWIIDLVIAFALLSGLGTLSSSATLLGRWLTRARNRAQSTLRAYPGLERMAFFGVVAYVTLPLAATGAVTGAFAARIVGLSRIAGVVAIAIGSFGTALAFALVAEFVGEKGQSLLQSPPLIGASLLIFLAGGRIAWVRVTRKLREPTGADVAPQFLARFEEADLLVVRPERTTAWNAWPTERFRLIVAADEGTPADYAAFARSAVDGGVTSALCLGKSAPDMQDAFLDASPETEKLEEVLSTRSAPDMPLDEALWEAWHVPPIQEESEDIVLVCVFADDPRFDELRRLAVDLERNFRIVLDRET